MRKTITLNKPWIKDSTLSDSIKTISIKENYIDGKVKIIVDFNDDLDENLVDELAESIGEKMKWNNIYDAAKLFNGV